MFSPRRRYYRKKNYKYYRNNLFAPSLRKAPVPNYYQMKGRILQQTPSHIKESDNPIMSYNKLNKMYQTLVSFKYPFPKAPPIDPDSFFYHYNTSNVNLLQYGTEFEFTQSGIYDTYVVPILAQLPPAPENYSYIFNVTYITFIHGLFTANDTSRFSFQWNNPILSNNPIDIITKNNDSSISGQIQLPVLAVSTGTSDQMRIARLNYGGNNIGVTFSVQTTTDEVTTDDGFYPLITNNEDSEIFGSKITYSTTTQSSPSYAMTSISFGIDILLKYDFQD